MRKGEVTLNDLKDSRIMFDKEVPSYGYFFILIVSVFIIASVVFAKNTPKVYIIQAKGVITNENANYVMCSYTGEITDCILEEGMLVEKGDVLFNIVSTDYNLQKEQLIMNLETYSKQIDQYKRLVKSIKDDSNYFDETNQDDSLYYNTFEAYKAKIVQNTFDAGTYKAYGYTEEQIEGEIEKNNGKLSEIYYEEIQNAENNIRDAELQKSNIESQLKVIESGRSAYEVKATADGVIHLLGHYKDGMVLQATATVASITPQNSNSVIEAYVSTEDMARMHKGDPVQIVIDGLAQNVYGTIKGEVYQIDSNVSMSQGANGEAVQQFRVLISLEQDYVISKTGEKINIVNGMTAVARIQYDKVTYADYVLEKLGLKVRK